jgi:signal transduction histidine kinase
VPERVRFRYRLDGFDRGWSPPVTTREAVYTNLGPGSYHFRVIASNSDGLWNSAEAGLQFEIEPALWQTSWFRASIVLVGGLAVWTLVRVRTHRMARQLNLRFEERLAERTRIAQELHDTLLQGFVSASMQLHVATDQLPDDAPAKRSLGRVLTLMGQVIEEGRNAVRGLRSSADRSNNLEQAFSRIPQELGIPTSANYRVIVEGRPRPLHPVIRDEVYRIGREALVNAFRHAGAKSIEVQLEYAAQHLRMLVRDDGCGIDPLVLRSGRDGHWGLSGMRERADRIGAPLKVWSRAAAGTEVELTVPRHIAFTGR